MADFAPVSSDTNVAPASSSSPPLPSTAPEQLSALLQAVRSLTERFDAHDARMDALEASIHSAPATTPVGLIDEGHDHDSDDTVYLPTAQVPMRERPSHSHKAPVFDVRDHMSTLNRIRAYHNITTDIKYRNAQSSYSALANVMAVAENFSLCTSSQQVHAAYNNLKVFAEQGPLSSDNVCSDDNFLIMFEENYRSAMGLTDEAIEADSMQEVYASPRKRGEEIYAYSMRHRSYIGQLNKLNPSVALTEAQQIALLLNALRLSSNPSFAPLLSSLRELSSGAACTMESIIARILKEPQASAFARAELRPVRRTMALLGAAYDSSDDDDGNGDFATAAPSTALVDVATASSSSSSSAAKAAKRRGKDRREKAHYVQRVIASYKVKGLNSFPRRDGLRRRKGKSEEQELREYYMELTGSPCGRCLRQPEVCSGKPDATSPPPCSQSDNKAFVHSHIVKAYKALLAYMHLSESTQYQMAAKSFYHHGGESFGVNEDVVRAAIDAGVKEFANSSYLVSPASVQAAALYDYAAPYDHTALLTQLLPPTALPQAAKKRALASLPDLGNPGITAGLCWWNEYSILLDRVGLLCHLRKASSSEMMGFGDGPQSPPLFILLQVPLWYCLKSGNPLLVFTNIRIVHNMMGLLDGKEQMEAMHLSVKLRPGRGKSLFRIFGQPACVADSGHHHFLTLSPPQKFTSGTTGQSLVRDEEGTLRAQVVQAKNHVHEGSFVTANSDVGSGLTVLPQDFFPELVITGKRPQKGKKRFKKGRNATMPGVFVQNAFGPLTGLSDSDSDSDDCSSDASLGSSSSLLSLVSISENISEEDDSDMEAQLLEHPYSRVRESVAYGSNVTRGVMSRSRMPLEDSALIARIPHIHDVLGHPSATQLIALLEQSGEIGQPLSPSIRQAVRRFECHFCAKRARRHTPHRPQVSVPDVKTPGENLHIDVGTFHHPTVGRFQAIVMTDKFSFFASGDAIDGAATTANTIPVVLHKTIDSYDTITYDLGGNFISEAFRTLLSRLGTRAVAVMAGAHWPLHSEKTVDLLRVELDAVFAQFSELCPSDAIQVAFQRLNDRMMTAYGRTRAEIHLGRQLRRVPLRNQLSALSPEWLPPSLREVESFLDATDMKRTQHVSAVARRRLASALRARLASAEPLELFNGDQFLVWHTTASRATTGYRGPAVCIGSYRSLVIGYQAGYLITAHISRCILHSRAANRYRVPPTSSLHLPARRNTSLETAVTTADADQLVSDDARDDSCGELSSSMLPPSPDNPTALGIESALNLEVTPDHNFSLDFAPSDFEGLKMPPDASLGQPVEAVHPHALAEERIVGFDFPPPVSPVEDLVGVNVEAEERIVGFDFPSSVSPAEDLVGVNVEAEERIVGFKFPPSVSPAEDLVSVNVEAEERIVGFDFPPSVSPAEGLVEVNVEAEERIVGSDFSPSASPVEDLVGANVEAEGDGELPSPRDFHSEERICIDDFRQPDSDVYPNLLPVLGRRRRRMALEPSAAKRARTKDDRVYPHESILGGQRAIEMEAETALGRHSLESAASPSWKRLRKSDVSSDAARLIDVEAPLLENVPPVSQGSMEDTVLPDLEGVSSAEEMQGREPDGGHSEADALSDLEDIGSLRSEHAEFFYMGDQVLPACVPKRPRRAMPSDIERMPARTDLQQRLASTLRAKKDIRVGDEEATPAFTPLPKHLRPKYAHMYTPRDDRHVYVYTPTTSGVYIQRVYLVDASKKRTVIIEYEDAVKIPAMRDAMRAEMQSYQDMNCVEKLLLADAPSGANLVSTRWVLGIKTREDGTKRYKARLVARGFEDQEKANVTRDSPTASSASQRIVLSVLAQKQWEVNSWDYATAFLQGFCLKREVFIAPPRAFFGPDVVWKLKRPVYGLVSAPKAWYDRLCEVITSCGFNSSVSG